ncbi:MAG: hypothetical protein K0Q58_312, partial [Microbacterium sp.]|nr:hypothetical protein [Microbacterium sp.]
MPPLVGAARAATQRHARTAEVEPLCVEVAGVELPELGRPDGHDAGQPAPVRQLRRLVDVELLLDLDGAGRFIGAGGIVHASALTR